MKKNISIIVAVCIVALFPWMSAAEELPPVGYEAIGNIDALWRWSGKVQTAMSSSTHPIGGNQDLSNFHGKYMGEKVLANIDGPGCVYRIWSAFPNGLIKFYLDGQKTPELVCGFKSYLRGKCRGLPGEFSVGRTAYYMPVCFQDSIVITAPGFNPPGYYQISYQTYDPEVPVESFSKKEARNDPGLEQAREIWAEGAAGLIGEGLKLARSEFNLDKGRTRQAVSISGPGIIRRISIVNADDPADPLEDLRLVIRWDGAKAPAVDAPVDAFFINRFDLKSHWPGGGLANMFVSADDSEYAAYFPMPFNSAEIGLVNKGEARRVVVEVGYESLDSLPGDAMRFHAAFREQDYETDMSDEVVITTNTAVDPETNYVVLDREGRGHYVGCAIFVESVGTVWWGEGDEMTYIDGALEPQIQGTGTEDEFNWSWGYAAHMSPVSGTLPVVPECDETIAAQIIPSLRNPDCNEITGHNAAYRFRPSDYVPFNSHIKVSYEVLGASWNAPNSILKGNWSQDRGDDYASIAYWYELGE